MTVVGTKEAVSSEIADKPVDEAKAVAAELSSVAMRADGGCVSQDFGGSPVPDVIKAAQEAEAVRRDPPLVTQAPYEVFESD